MKEKQMCYCGEALELSRGLCSKCYWADYRQRNATKLKDYNNEYYTKVRSKKLCVNHSSAKNAEDIPQLEVEKEVQKEV